MGRSAIKMPMTAPTGLAIEKITVEIRNDLTDKSDCAMFNPKVMVVDYYLIFKKLIMKDRDR